MNIGVTEMILILAVVLIFFGPSRLPSLGKSIGEGINAFKKGLNGTFNSEKKSAEQKKEDENKSV